MNVTLRPQWFARGGKISGGASALGSWQICHSVCTSLIALLATMGLAVSGMPLLFLNRFQWPLWIAAGALFVVILGMRLGLKMRGISGRGIIGNGGLLLAGLPFEGVWVASARLGGFLLVIVTLAWYLKDQIIRRAGNNVVIDLVENGKKIAAGVVGVIVIGALGRFSIVGLQNQTLTAGLMSPPVFSGAPSRMRLSLFDVAYAKELMDKDGDGRCDACSMDITQCIDAGMMQCTMDRQAKIGLLSSQHIHANFKVYLKGAVLNFANPAYYMKSSFLHVDDQANKDEASGVLHLHATGVPLSLFFQSIGLTFRDGLKAYVNGHEITDYQNYVFKDRDKLLITDGVGDLNEQLNSITDFAKKVIPKK